MTGGTGEGGEGLRRHARGWRVSCCQQRACAEGGWGGRRLTWCCPWTTTEYSVEQATRSRGHGALRYYVVERAGGHAFIVFTVSSFPLLRPALIKSGATQVSFLLWAIPMVTASTFSDERWDYGMSIICCCWTISLSGSFRVFLHGTPPIPCTFGQKCCCDE